MKVALVHDNPERSRRMTTSIIRPAARGPQALLIRFLLWSVLIGLSTYYSDHIWNQ